jgi:hypothetical protein
VFSPLWVFLTDWGGFTQAATVVGMAMATIVLALAAQIAAAGAYLVGRGRFRGR